MYKEIWMAATTEMYLDHQDSDLHKSICQLETCGLCHKSSQSKQLGAIGHTGLMSMGTSGLPMLHNLDTVLK